MKELTKNFKTILKDFSFVEFDKEMKHYTSYNTGGRVDILAKPNNVDQLVSILKTLRENKIPTTILGACTNVLVGDKGIRGAVVLTSGLIETRADKDLVICQAGVSMAKFAAYAHSLGLGGTEAVSGIPGSVGGAVYMNAGSYGVQVNDILEYSLYLDDQLNVVRLEKDHHQFGFRKSFYTDKNYIILEAGFLLKPRDKDLIKEDMKIFAAKRKASQPLEYSSCGSVFKRPPGNYAGKLIEDAGLKGYKVGGAMVSPKHAGFIVNTGDALTQDIIEIIDFVRDTVYNKYNIDLELEVRIIGER